MPEVGGSNARSGLAPVQIAALPRLFNRAMAMPVGIALWARPQLVFGLAEFVTALLTTAIASITVRYHMVIHST